MNNMEIKQGDKVRVSKDAPKLITGGCDMSQIVCTVCCVDKDVAAINITNDERTKMKVWIVPTKYLVKVDAEAKEAKFKVGDKVRVKDSVLFEGCVFSIIGADYREKLGWRYELNIHEWYPEIDLDLYTEPTEQPEAEEETCVGRINFAERIKRQQEAHQAIVDEFRSRSFDWDAYTADLAKEVALKVANKYNDPNEAAEYAVSVTNAVVEGLKRK